MKVNCSTLIEPKLRKHIVSLCKFTLLKTLTKRQIQKLEGVSIRVDKTLNEHVTDQSAIPLAYADPLYEDRSTPTSFIIWLNPYFTKKNLTKYARTLLAETIIHETIHVKQSLIGQMKHVELKGKVLIKFEKKYYKLDSNNDYWLFPWEVEARGYERGMLNLYCIENGCFKYFPDYSDVL